MRRAIADSIVLLGAYLIAYLLRFDFETPRWGWTNVLLGFGSAFVLGWCGLLLFRCQQLAARTISLRNLQRFVFAALFTVAVQLLLRYFFVYDDFAIYLRPPIGVTLMAGALEVLGLLGWRYVQRLQLRPIEVADLLGRLESEVGVPVVLESLRDKVVMITGAGGSIGSELARQVFAAKPAKLILFDISEAALYLIHSELSEKASPTQLIPVVGSVGHRERVRDLLLRERPEFLFHAAAYKHVPMMEYNPVEALSNNALASRVLAEEALAAEVETFVLVSTDKAIRPISAMGISKRLTEIFVQDLAGRGKTKFCAVRFGNVLGSSGSVVLKFREQIAKGGPVTVTDARMKRYFMTIAEASGLILQAATFAKGGEIFILDMGEPMTILKLAETMITLAGLRPYKDIPIVFSGIRPGEKLSEELGLSSAQTERTEHARIFVERIAQHPHQATEALLAQCTALAEQRLAVTVEMLQTLLQEEGNAHEVV